jgi:hypothetical protein
LFAVQSAQLKARPGRQDWENSPDWVKYTAWPTEDVVRLRQASWEERLAAAAKLKDEANAVFEQVNLAILTHHVAWNL